MREPSVRESEPAVTPATPKASSRTGASAPMVERAFMLLDLLAGSDAGYSLSELARRLGMSKGSMFGLLKTLEKGGVVEVDEDRRYAPGPRIYNLAQAYIRRSGLRRLVLPAMQRLTARTGETVFLGQVESDGVRIVDLVEVPNGPTALRLSARRGAHLHLLAGATGRVVLADWPLSRREEYLRLRPLPRFTKYSITDQDAYLAAVEETAHTGIGMDREEYLVGVSAVAAAIHGLAGELLALVWIVGFSASFSAETLQLAGEALREETRAISQALGAN
jgi:DNA-binding IclR family transcriptional regulator